ncbi:tetratricopeptide repeat protein [Helicobacter pylori]|uniref:tetratricopeptide repeat protein n=1 Tax=Helicobacter pylori TaxID=210 RepID=UPI00165A2C2D|nr:tetratricopeptide repeat protein [Helicobacter pylori]
MAEPTPKELVDQGKEILDFAVSDGGGTFRGDSLEAKKYYIQDKEYFEKACNLNYAKGCVSLGGLYEGKNLVIGEENPRLKERLKKAIQYYSKACDLKDGEGCGFLGISYEYGYNGVVKKDFKKAIQYYVKACELDNGNACLGILLRSYDGKVNKQEVFQYLSKACELNSGSGCLMLGGLYRKDFKKAAQYYSKACDLNDEFGCSTLGAMQYIGKGVVKNEKQAMEKFEKACKLGKQEACEMVTYKGLCELGHKEACEIFSLEVLCESSDQKACDMSYDKRKALGF